MRRSLAAMSMLMASGCDLDDRAAAGWRRFALPWLTAGSVVEWNLRTPSSVLIHGGWVYFTEIGKRRAVQRLPVTGGRRELVASCSGSAFWLAASDTRLYWTEVESGLVRSFEFATREIRTHAMHRPEPNMIVAGRNRAWWVEYSGDRICAVDEQGSAKLAHAREESPDRLATDGSWLAWTLLTLGETGPLRTAPAAGGRPRTVTHVRNQVDLAVADGTVFCLEGRARTLWSIPVEGGKRTILCDSVGSVGNVTVHGSFVYWSEEFADTIRRVPRSGGPVQTLSRAVHPEVLSVDGQFVYWAEPTTHSIRKIPLPDSPHAN